MIRRNTPSVYRELSWRRGGLPAAGIAAGLAGLTLLSACAAASGENGVSGQVELPAAPHELVLYSPSPAKAELHVVNVEYGEILAECGVAESVKVIPVALPDSINEVGELPAGEKLYHLPIVTTLDFAPAISGTAPDWHGYAENPDLVFVTGLYEVGYGVMVFDPALRSPEDLIGKRIAVPPRPSSVRWATEALFRDGWGIEDEVTFVEMFPPAVPGALASGDVDAVVWNLMHQMPEGYSPLLPILAARPDAAWIDIDAAAIDRINAANTFATAQLTVDMDAILGADDTLEGTAQMMSFQQGLAAWRSTPDGLIEDILSCMEGADLPFGSGEPFSRGGLEWPGLTPVQTHPAAR